MKRFKEADGFVFDCDGTLLDTLGAWDEAERDLFEQAGPLTQGQEDEIHSAPIEQAAEILHAKYGVGSSPEAVLAHLDDFLLPYYRDEAEPMPGACEFVRAISEKGVPCVVVSSSPRRYLDAGLRRVGIRGCFVDLVTTDEVSASKRDFAIYEHAMNVLGSGRGATWAVDDAPYAIGVMADFGFRTIGIAAGCAPDRRRALQSRSELVVETLCDFLPR